MKRLNLAKQPYENLAPWNLTSMVLGVLLLLGVLYTGLKLVPLLRDRALVEGEISKQEEQIERLEKRQGDLQSAINSAEYRGFARDANAASALLEKRKMSWLQLFADLEEVKPYNSFFSGIRPDFTEEGIFLTIQGVALNHDELLALESRIMASPRFSKMVPKGDIREGDGGPRFEFTITMFYHPLEDAPEEQVGTTLGVSPGRAR